MNKKIVLSILFFNSLMFSKTFYYMKYEQDKKILESEITKEAYLKILDSKEKYFIDENDELVKVIKTYKEEYEDIEDYKNKEIKTEIIKEVLTTKTIKNDEATENINDFDYKKYITVHRVFIFIIVFIFLFKFLKKKNIFKRKIKKIFEQKTEEIKENIEIKTEIKNEIAEHKKEDFKILDYKDLEIKRVEIFKDFKYNKTIKTENKKLIYQKLRELKKDILNKKDLSFLNKNIIEIEKDINNA